MKQNDGFTLLEILLSLTLVAALGSIFIVISQKISQRDQVNMAVLQINAINGAAIDYYKMYKQWPSSLGTLSFFLGHDPTCSVWKNTTGACMPYTITSTPTAHYFALSVGVPTAAASRLQAALPTAYLSSNTVTSYTSTFSGLKLPAQSVPPGVLLSATNQQLNGSCNTSTYANPFTSCVSTTRTSSYGLLDLNNQTKNSIVDQNVFATMRGVSTIGASFTTTAAPTCAAGMLKTMIFLPVGIRTSINSNGAFRYSYAYFNSRLQATLNPFVGNSSDTSKYQNISAGVGDVLCLPATALTGWPNA